MKVYIDENDIGRKIATYHDGTNTQQGLYIYGKDKIIIQPLADYTKQVRKEVCEDIKKKVLEYFNVKNEEEYENSLSLLDALFTADVVFEILEKIGEKEC